MKHNSEYDVDNKEQSNFPSKKRLCDLENYAYALISNLWFSFLFVCGFVSWNISRCLFQEHMVLVRDSSSLICSCVSTSHRCSVY